MATSLPTDLIGHAEAASGNSDAFVTSFGRGIRFVPGYFDLVKEVVGLPKVASRDFQIASTNVAGGADKLDYTKAQELNEQQQRMTLYGYTGRYTACYPLLWLLDQTDIHPHFRRMLDIGTGFGIQPRVLKGLGMVDETVGNDLWDRASAIDEGRLRRQHRKMRWLKHLDRMQTRIMRKPEATWSDFERALVYKVSNPRLRMKLGGGWMPGTDLYDRKFVRKPTLDRMITGNVYDIEERFDLITAFSVIDWFRAEEIFAKISSMLEDNGVFFMWGPNWWHAVTGGRVAGHFPFAAQRLTREDFRRYVDTHLPENAEALKQTYDYFDPLHPTMRDYIRIAHENGMELAAYHATLSPTPYNKKYGVTSRGWADIEPGVFDDVLADIHQFRPDITHEDLMPFAMFLLFRKVDRNRKAQPGDFRDLHARMERSIRMRAPKPWMRQAGKLWHLVQGRRG
ncbi:MAG: hypothetical protein AB7N54_04220 [Alphaproteobacteria bacterium]